MVRGRVAHWCSLLLGPAAALCLAACKAEFASEPVSILIERRDSVASTLRVGDARVIEIVVKHPRLGEVVAPQATWSSSNDAVLRVSSVPFRNTADSAAVDSLSARRTRVLVTAVGTGTARLTVSLATVAVEQSFPVSVTPLVATPALKVAAGGNTLAVSEEDELEANLNGDASLRISWQSSDDSKLRVQPFAFVGNAARDTLAARGRRARVIALGSGQVDLTGTVRTSSGEQLASTRLSVTVLPLRIVRQWPASMSVGDSLALSVRVQDILGRPVPGLTVSWTSSDDASLLLAGTGTAGRTAASAAIASLRRGDLPGTSRAPGASDAVPEPVTVLPSDSAMWVAALRRGTAATVTLRIEGVAAGESAVTQEAIRITERWVDLTVGEGSTCALTFDGRPYCWGRICRAGGDATRCARVPSVETPVRVTGSTQEEAIRFRRLRGGPGAVCGESAFSPRLWSCWGDDVAGVITGNNTSTTSQFLPFASPLLPGALPPPTDVFVGGTGACGLVDYQFALVTFCWGNNLGGLRELLVVTPCDDASGGLGCTDWIKDAAGIAFGGGFACAFGPRTASTDAGSFAAHGAGCWSTSLLRAATPGRYELPAIALLENLPNAGAVVPKAARVLPAGLRFKSLAATGKAACGVSADADGRAICWGNTFPGSGTALFEEVLGGPFTAVTGTGEASDAGAPGATDRFCGVANGTAWCWTPADHTPGPEPKPPEDIAVLRISATHQCAITRPTGALYCWGGNQNGELGVGTKGGSASVPGRVVEPRGTS